MGMETPSSYVWPPSKIQCARTINFGVLSTLSMGLEMTGFHLIPGLEATVNKMLCCFL